MSRFLKMTVEDAAKVIISAGMVVPDYQARLKQLADKARKVGYPSHSAAGFAAAGAFDRQSRKTSRRPEQAHGLVALEQIEQPSQRLAARTLEIADRACSTSRASSRAAASRV